MWDMNQSNKNRSIGFSCKENSFSTIRRGWFLWGEESKALLSDSEGGILIAEQFNRKSSDKNPTPFRLYFWNLLVLLNKRRHKVLLLEPLLKTEFWIEVQYAKSSSCQQLNQSSCVYPRNGSMDSSVYSCNRGNVPRQLPFRIKSTT